MNIKNNWLSVCKKKLNKTNKKIILIGGASSAGKTYKCNMLKQYLQQFNKKVLVISLDNFYKPISNRIVQNACKQSNLINYYDIVVNIVKNATINYSYDDKFCNKNVNNILNKLCEIFDKTKADDLLNNIINNFKNINFDEPSAIDFDNIVNQINCDDQIIVPNYSFKTSEILSYTSYNKSDYDYIIFEGIFALYDSILNKIDKNKVITISIKSDMLTMLSRRLYRDIIKDRRTRSPKDTFESYFEQVMPCYFKYIMPTLNNTDIKINSVLTYDEINEKEYLKQVNNINIEIIDKNCKNIKLFITFKQNHLEKIVFKYKSKNIIKYDEYDLQELLQQNDIKKLEKYFKSINMQIKYNKEINY